MLAQLGKSYSPAEAEREISDRWDRSGVFAADPGDPGPPYCIIIPPPNVTAALHVGHAFNNTLQDVLIRYHRMRGCNVLWMPGTDHAGISTQAIVEKRLLQQGIRRADLGREEFVARVQAWKDEYEATIIEQLKALGCSCDWRRVRFTMDEMCARAVREAFFRLFSGNLLYRGKRLVNWDPVTLTALADDEVEMREVDGHMWYLRYPLVPEGGHGLPAAGGPAVSEHDPEHVTVATTRPETMLGDTAVAMNPKDPRAAKLVGRFVRLPIVDRIVPIIADEHVVLPGDPDNPLAEFATGFLKVTPAHDPNDWEIGIRHGLPVSNVLAPDATISRDHGWPREEFTSGRAAVVALLLGSPREEARRRVVEWFEARGLLEGVREYRHAVGHSYRSHVPVEPYLSDQWYVGVTDDAMRGEALRALDPDQYEGTPPRRAGGRRRAGDGELDIFPARYARTYQAWHENLRDWCISRQLWWGHRIPVWFAPAAGREGRNAWSALESQGRVAARAFEGRLYVCVHDASDEDAITELERRGYVQDPDVLDTWFSAGLWPISTMGWPAPEDFPETVGLLEAFNPSSVLVTARDIITLWVSRMVMFNRYFRDGALPFRHVYINPMIQDGYGQRMSKSLGNGVDPRDIIHSHGADALRFILVQMATSTQDVRLPVDTVCPHCGEAFHPKETTSPEGYRVAAPRQECPACRKPMASAFGASSGLAGRALPVARNTSSRFDQGRNFANKLWNAARFAVTNLAGSAERPIRDDERGLMDRWIIERLRHSLDAVEAAVQEYQFNVYADLMYDLVWRDFCDWYLEAIKPTVRSNPLQQRVLRAVLDSILRMLHPICPFVTEAIWPHLNATGAPGADGVELGDAAHADVLASASWPRVTQPPDEDVAAIVDRLQSLTGAIRNLRARHNVGTRAKVLLLATPAVLALVADGEGVVETLAGLSAAEPLEDGGARPTGAIPFAFEGEELLLAGAAAVDVQAERLRLTKITREKEKSIIGFRQRLLNHDYLAKAPAHLVEETKSRMAEAQADLEAARRALELLEE